MKKTLLLILLLIVSCSGSTDESGFNVDELWYEVVDCLSDTPWVEPFNGHFQSTVPLTMPEVRFVKNPCGLEIGECLTELHLAVPKSCVGIVEVWENGNIETIVHGFYHSIHAQNHCGLLFPGVSIPDNNHFSELFDPEFKCYQEVFND